MSSRLETIRTIRLEKVKKLRALEIDPYPAQSKKDYPNREIVENFPRFDGKIVTLTGRLMSWREHGEIVFGHLRDQSGDIQLFVRSDSLEKTNKVHQSIGFSDLDFLDIGDFVQATGTVVKTRTGEISLQVTHIRLLTKAIRPLPEKWHGLKDIEERYRQRHIDLILNEESRKVFLMRTRVVQFLRTFLDKHGFIDVETPVLQPIYGGASAKPFVTHHEALDADLYLRISDELYLKRLIVGGFDRVYEIGKDFRNEGIDRAHNPEFTMLEFYWAYADYQRLMAFTEEMVCTLVKELEMKMTQDFTPPWPRISYRDAILQYAGIDIDKANTDALLQHAINEKHIRLDMTGVVGFGALLDTLYKETIRPHLTGPLFLVDRPTEFVTLAKRRPDDPTKTASFQLLISGEEVVNAYNELNDPQDQAARWRESEELGKKGKAEHEAFDADYIRALEYGMPPTAGWGMGIDRFVAILTHQPSLKDTILFPTLRPV